MIEPTTLSAGAKLIQAVRPLHTAKRDVTRHNTEAQRLYEDLASWVKDDNHQFEIDLLTITNALADRGALRSGEFAHQRRERKRYYFQRFRDQQRAMERRLEDLHAAEALPHRFWRWRHQTSCAWPTNPRHAEIEEILDCWRTPEVGGNGEVLTIDEPD